MRSGDENGDLETGRDFINKQAAHQGRATRAKTAISENNIEPPMDKESNARDGRDTQRRPKAQSRRHVGNARGKRELPTWDGDDPLSLELFAGNKRHRLGKDKAVCEADTSMAGLLKRLGDLCYDEFYHESHEAFESKLAHPGSVSSLLVDTETLRPLGYFITLMRPSVAEIPSLHQASIDDGDAAMVEEGESGRKNGGILYCHDLALLPQTRGQGLATPLIEATLERARREKGARKAVLVAIFEAREFWIRRGFKPVDASSLDERTMAKLATYGEGALMMSKDL